MKFLYFLEGLRNPVCDFLFSLITHLGEETFFLAIAIFIFWCVDKRGGYYVLMTGLIGTVINQWLKIVCRIPRPWVGTDFKPIDAVLVTHEHYDHVGGLDDLRPYCRFRDVPVYAEGYMAQRLRERIPYCFAEQLYPGVPRILLEEVTPGVPFYVSNTEGKQVEILPIRVMHGKLPILGYRIGNMAWVTDMLMMPDTEYAQLQGLEVLVMNALRPMPHGTHQSISEALENVKRLAPQETYFIHMSHHVGLHEEAEKQLPPHVHFAYDGLTIQL